jgi:hypothetical protein
MIRPLLVVAVAATALLAFVQPRVSPLPAPPPRSSNGMLIASATVEAMGSVDVLQGIAASQGPYGATARASLQRSRPPPHGELDALVARLDG